MRRLEASSRRYGHLRRQAREISTRNGSGSAVLAGFGLEVPARADVRYVDAFAPTDYAFKGYRRGLTPADHALGKVLRAGTPPPPPVKKD